ncbi:hypothetical protein LTR94_028005, partial [Friedmanniomyces endolithicus]
MIAGAAPLAMAQEADHHDDEAEEVDEVIVQATRSGRRIRNEPIRVEVIGREEIEEKALMSPGNIAMLLNETEAQLLADGLPLYGGQASSLGVLQIPPMDVGQVEVIKGAASTALRPWEGSSIFRDGQDLTAYGAAPISENWSALVIGGYHRQSRQDLNDDGWSDIAAYDRWTVRPRLFWNGDNGASVFATVG